MNIKIETRGIKKLQGKLNGLPKFVDKEVAAIMTNVGTKTVQSARNNHRFKSVSGNLERSIQSEYKKDGKKHTLQIGIDPQLVTSGGFNYGWIQHDGSGSGYKRSNISPRVTPHKFKNGGGIKHDHFLSRAWERYSKVLNRSLKALPDRIKRYL